MTWLRGLLSWLFRPSLALLERQASEYGTLSLQQVHNGELEWWCELRSDARHDEKGRKYAWKGHGLTIRDAIADSILEAQKNPIGAKPILPMEPKLGTREFDA